MDSLNKQLLIILLICFLLIGVVSCSQKPVSINPEESEVLFVTPDLNNDKNTTEQELPTPVGGMIETPQSDNDSNIGDSNLSHPINDLGTYKPEVSIMGLELNRLTDAGGVALAKNAGAHWLRRNALMWSEVEPTEGTRNWDAIRDLEQEMILASESGFELILVIRSTPQWAQEISGIPCGPIKAEKIQAFASFIGDAVIRYGDSPYNVRYWEIWNEPDVPAGVVNPDGPFGCWGNPNDPFYGGGEYAEMLKLAYPQIKSANPNAQVLVGGLLMDCDPINPPETSPGSGQFKDCKPSTYLEGIIKQGGGDYFDGVSFHAYDYYIGSLAGYANPNWNSSWDTTGPVLIAKSDYLRRLLDANGLDDKYLINTEVALLCGRDGSEEYCQDDIYEKSKADYLAQAYSSAFSRHLYGNVWYSLTGWRGSALVGPGDQEKYAFQAFQTSNAMLTGAEYQGYVTDFPGVKGYKFSRDDQIIWIIWALGKDVQIEFDNIPEQIIDSIGKPTEVTSEYLLTVEPVYILWNK